VKLNDSLVTATPFVGSPALGAGKRSRRPETDSNDSRSTGEGLIMPTTKKPQQKPVTAEDREAARRALQMYMDTRQ